MRPSNKLCINYHTDCALTQFCLPQPYNPTDINIQKMYADIPSFTPSRCSSKRTFAEDRGGHSPNPQENIIQRGSTEFWDELYQGLLDSYKGLAHKMSLAQQSFKIHKEALGLKNLQALELENNIQKTHHKSTALNTQIKKHEIRAKEGGHKCHQLKQECDVIRTRINKEQAVLLEQEKHRAEILSKIQKIEEETKGLRRELQQSEEKEDYYYEICEENQKLKAQYELRDKQYSLVQLKVEKQHHDEQSMQKKLSQLETIVAMKEKHNRELGKKLFQLKKVNPQSRNQVKLPTVEQLDMTIEGMEAEYSRMQQTLLDLTDKITDIHQKTRHKEQEVTEIKRRMRIMAEEEKSKQLEGLETTSPKKISPKGYRIIESEEDENFMYPKIARSHLSNQGDSKSQQGHSLSGGQPALQLSPSVKNLIEKYDKIVSKGHQW